MLNTKILTIGRNAENWAEMLHVLGVSKDDCAAFENINAGVEAAINGADKVLFVVSTEDNPSFTGIASFFKLTEAQGIKVAMIVQMPPRDFAITVPKPPIYTDIWEPNGVPMFWSIPSTPEGKDETTCRAAYGLYMALNLPGLLNLDYEDIQEITRNRALNFAFAAEKGDDRAEKAVEKLLAQPFVHMYRAERALLVIGSDVTLSVSEINQIITGVKQENLSVKMEVCSSFFEQLDDTLQLYLYSV
jgi:hypothetical protein